MVYAYGRRVRTVYTLVCLLKAKASSVLGLHSMVLQNNNQCVDLCPAVCSLCGLHAVSNLLWCQFLSAVTQMVVAFSLPSCVTYLDSGRQTITTIATG